ncbi:GTP pyrophosphokinase [Demequina phytophila]|uniref:GTP pyrophosphokinase n=1 Tax=Demequina phytophila TaxID=1638981 RepID=UPI000781CFFD|nr:GTP pyrophosphokinase family protein [Demequina phytophila]
MTALARATPAPLSPDQVRVMRKDIQRFLLQYEFGLREVETKLSILRDEFLELHDYNPIEHVSSRVKSPESLLDKVARKGLSRDLEAIRAHITDIAGVRVTCAFVTDVYRLFELLTRQDDIRVLEVKDYIATPKPNGYQSLHAIIEIPVFLSTGTTAVTVEVQFRTIAMDFWASLEHRIYYKYDASVPSRLTEELREAAATAAELDSRMARLHRQIHGDGPHMD